MMYSEYERLLKEDEEKRQKSRNIATLREKKNYFTVEQNERLMQTIILSGPFEHILFRVVPEHFFKDIEEMIMNEQDKRIELVMGNIKVGSYERDFDVTVVNAVAGYINEEIKDTTRIRYVLSVYYPDKLMIGDTYITK